MAEFLIVYSTQKGQTEKIVRFIESDLKENGYDVDVFNVKEVPKNLNLEKYRAVIAGGPVLMQGFPRILKKWVQDHTKILKKMPTAFFSVCLGVLQKDDEIQKEERDIVLNFFEATHWHPAVWTIFPGALSYTSYSWLMKRIMRSISRKAGGDTDITRNFEYTDWNEVRKFSRDFSQTASNASQSR